MFMVYGPLIGAGTESHLAGNVWAVRDSLVDVLVVIVSIPVRRAVVDGPLHAKPRASLKPPDAR